MEEEWVKSAKILEEYELKWTRAIEGDTSRTINWTS
jgi:hypothetical protein